MAALTFTLPVAGISLSVTGGATDGADPQMNLILTDSAATPNTLTIVALTQSKDDLLTFVRQIEDAVR